MGISKQDLENMYTDKAWGIRKISRESGVSRNHIDYLIKDVYGLTRTGRPRKKKLELITRPDGYQYTNGMLYHRLLWELADPLHHCSRRPPDGDEVLHYQQIVL